MGWKDLRSSFGAQVWQGRQTSQQVGATSVRKVTAIMHLTREDALIIVDVQKDFLPGGKLGVRYGDEVVPVLNRYISLFDRMILPVFATRDWHPMDHCSFAAQGGPWPAHCIAASEGAQFANSLSLPARTVVISKATKTDKDAYSGFEGTDLAERLRKAGVRRVLVGGLATDYCVLNTVRDALQRGFETVLLLDAIRPVEVHPGDGERAIAEMRAAGANTTDVTQVSA